MLTSKKLLQIHTKQSSEKPPYVKPVYKSYIQLLGLDKPKKKLYVETDNQNDDFLEKLLRQEENGKKSKKNKSKASKSRANKDNQSRKRNNDRDLNDKKNTNNNNNKNNQSPPHNQNKTNHRNDNKFAEDQFQNPEIQMKNQKIRKQSISDKDMNKFPQGSPREQQLLREGARKIQKRMQNAKMEEKNSQLEGNNHNVYNSRMSGNNEIVIDQTDQVPYVINNSLKKKNIKQSVKSQKAFKLLNSRRQEDKKDINKRLSIGTILNSQKKQIQHKFMGNGIRQQFKAKILSTQKLMSMTDYKMDYKAKKRFQYKKQENLFESLKHQRIFMDNLRKSQILKRSKLSLPQFS